MAPWRRDRLQVTTVANYIRVLGGKDDNLIMLEEVGEEIFCSGTLSDSPAVILVPGRVDECIVEVDNKGVGLLVGCGKGIGQEFVPDGVRHAVAC